MGVLAAATGGAGGGGGGGKLWESELQQQVGPWTLAAERVHQAGPWAMETCFPSLSLPSLVVMFFIWSPMARPSGRGHSQGPADPQVPWGQAGLHAAHGPHSQARAQLGRREQQVLVAVGWDLGHVGA